VQSTESGGAPCTSQSTNVPTPFSPRYYQNTILKIIPRGARDTASEMFNTLLGSFEISSRSAGMVVTFSISSRCLAQPSDRGGKRRNFTSLILNQIRSFSEAETVVKSDSNECRKDVRRRKGKKVTSVDEAAAKRAAARLDEGDVKGAIRLLCSSETIAEQSEECLNCFLTKHPSPPVSSRQKSSTDSPNLVVSPEQVKKAIKSFLPGSSGGLDGLRPQQIKDMTERQIGGTLITTLTHFVNFVLARNVPACVRPFFSGPPY